MRSKIGDDFITKEFIKFSIIASTNNAISQLLYLLDIFIIGIIVSDVNVIAIYKTATIIPFALNFLPLSIMTFVYPYFARNNLNVSWMYNNYLKLLKTLAALNLIISLLLVGLAPFIIKVCFGSGYLKSIVPFRILSVWLFCGCNFLEFLQEIFW